VQYETDSNESNPQAGLSCIAFLRRFLRHPTPLSHVQYM
jgi:hypothetical protein